MSSFPPLPSHPHTQHPHAPGSHSYADTAAHNAPPPSAQPHPDLNLLNTEPPKYTGQIPINDLPDIDSKVNVVPNDWKAHPETTASARLELEHTDESETDDDDKNRTGSSKRKARKQKAKREHKQKQVVGQYAYWQNKLFQPAVFGGIFSVVNVGLLGGLGYLLYTRPHTRTSPTFLGASGLGLLVLFSGEGYVAEQYLETPEGQRELERAEKEGAALYRHSKEVILRPGVFGGLFGAVNVAVLGALGYFGYTHWEYPGIWTRKNIGLASVGLATWISLQGFVAEKYRQDAYYKYKKH